MDNPHSPSLRKVLFAMPFDVTDQPGEQWKKIAKLHKQFAHLSSERLIKLIRNAGIIDKSVGDIVDDVTTSCDVCKRFKKAPPRPAVGFPLATVFNETVVLDLKVFRSGYVGVCALLACRSSYLSHVASMIQAPAIQRQSK